MLFSFSPPPRCTSFPPPFFPAASGSTSGGFLRRKSPGGWPYVAEQEGGCNWRSRQACCLLDWRTALCAMRFPSWISALGGQTWLRRDVVQETVGLVGRRPSICAGRDSRAHSRIRLPHWRSIDRLHNASKDMARLCEELSSHYRGLMLIKTMKDARGILAVSDDEFEQMTKQALSTPLSEILHGLDTLQGAFRQDVSRRRPPCRAGNGADQALLAGIG